MADGYVSSIQLPNNNTYNIKDKNAITEIQIDGETQTKTNGVVNLPARVTQSNITSDNYKAIMLGYEQISDDTPYSTSSVTGKIYKTEKFQYNPSGGILKNSGHIDIKSDNLDRDGEAPTSDQTGKSLYFVDKDNNGVGRIYTVQRTTNKKDLFITVYNASGTSNSIGIRILDDGTQSYYLSNPSAFRAALSNAAYIGTNDLVNNEVIIADGTDGKLKSSGKTIVTSITNTDDTLPTAKAVKTFVEGKGYVTTDEKVKQSTNSEAKNFPLLFSKAETSNTTADITDSVYRNNSIYINPSTKQIFVDNNAGSQWKKGRETASFIKTKIPTAYSPITDIKSTSGDWSIGTVNNTENLYFIYTTDDNYSGSGNKALKYYLEGADSTNSYAILHSGNYNSYSPTLTGTGASGDWGINIIGNAATATKATQDSDGNTITTTYLKLSGGTMTGAINFKSSNLDRNNPPSSETTSDVFCNFQDKDGNYIGRVVSAMNKNGDIELILRARARNAADTGYLLNDFKIIQSRNGTRSYSISSPDNFRVALGNAAYIGTNEITNNEVIIADGTDGKLKTSGCTINKTVPNDAVFTDEKVTQEYTTSGNDYRVLLSYGANNTTEIKGARKSEYLLFNPSTKTLTTTNLQVGGGIDSGTLTLYTYLNGAFISGELIQPYNGTGGTITHSLPLIGGDLFGSGNVSAGAGITINASGDRYTIESKNKFYLHKTYTSLFSDIDDDTFRNCKYFKIYYKDSNNCNHNCITINMNTDVFPTSSTTSYIKGKIFTLSCVGDVNKTYLRTATFHFETKSGGGVWKLVFNSSFLWDPSAAIGSSITWTSTKQTSYSNSYIEIIKLEYFLEDT